MQFLAFFSFTEYRSLDFDAVNSRSFLPGAGLVMNGKKYFKIEWSNSRESKDHENTKAVATLLNENAFKSPCLCWGGNFALNSRWTLAKQAKSTLLTTRSLFSWRTCLYMYKNSGKWKRVWLFCCVSQVFLLPCPCWTVRDRTGWDAGVICSRNVCEVVVQMNLLGFSMSKFGHRDKQTLLGSGHQWLSACATMFT